jgi:hypothetical protein
MLIVLFLCCSFSVLLGEILEHDNLHALFSLEFLLLWSFSSQRHLLSLNNKFLYFQYYIIVGTKKVTFGCRVTIFMLQGLKEVCTCALWSCEMEDLLSGMISSSLLSSLT